MKAMIKRLPVFLLLLIALLPVQAQRSDRAKRIGERMWCMCGCNQILTQCNHVGCSTSTAMLKKLDARIEGNEPDDLLIQAFVQEYGTAVLSQPPAQGLALAGYVLPGVALLAGLGVVLLVIHQWRRVIPAPAAAGTRKIPADVLERARRQADRETDVEADSGGAGE